MAVGSWTRLALAVAACAVIDAGAAAYAWIAHQDGIAAIDVERLTIVANIAKPARDVAALPGSRFVYAVDQFAGIAKIDSDALAVVAEHRNDAIGTNTQDIELKPGRDEAYVLDGSIVHVLRTDILGYVGFVEGVNTVQEPVIDAVAGRAFFRLTPTSLAEVDLASNRRTRELPGAPAFEAHPALRRLYLVAPTRIDVLDLESGTVVATFNHPQMLTPWSARLNPAGSRLFVTDVASNAVRVFDVPSLALLATIPVGATPRGIDISPDGSRVFVVNEDSGDVSVIDVATLSAVARIPVGSRPSSRGRFIGGSTSAASLATGPATGLWWNAAEPGWGVHIAQRRSTFFAAIFHYDAAGAAKWFVAPNCATQVPCPDCIEGVTCNGPVYETGGPAFFLAPFNPGTVQTREVGLMELQFTDRDRAQLTYVIAGQHRGVPIRRQVFAAQTPISPDYTDLWWNPLESGWGLGITQQSNVMFLTWFVYDDSGQPVWYVASDCRVIAAGNGCRGTLYRTSGPIGPVPGTAGFNASALRVSPVGTIDVTFEGANNGVITYTVDGRTGTKAITRQLF